MKTTLIVFRNCRIINLIFLLLATISGFSQTNPDYSEMSCADIDPTLASEIFMGFPEEYSAICTDPNLIKYIRVNYHYILKDDGTGNFNELSDGNGNALNNGFVRANEIIAKCNEELAANMEMWLPCNTTHTVKPNIVRYVLTGVYFHRNTSIYNSGVFDFAVHDLYGIDKQTTLNIYDMPVPPLSADSDPKG